MKQTWILIVLTGLLMVGCKQDPYPGYKVAYNEAGIIVLRHPDSLLSVSQMLSAKSKTTDPGAGKPIKREDAIAKIEAYQCETAGEPTTKYVDLYYPSLRDFILKMVPQGATDTEYGVRVYFAGNSPSYSVILAPLKKTGRADPNRMDIMEPLWYTQPDQYTAFNYGSVCPEKCPGGDLTGLEGTSEKARIDSLVRVKLNTKKKNK